MSYPNNIWCLVDKYGVLIILVCCVHSVVEPCCGISSRRLTFSSSLVPGRLFTDVNVQSLVVGVRDVVTIS